MCIIALFLRTIVLLWFTFFIHIFLSLPQSIVLTAVQRIGNSSLKKTCNNYALIHHVPCPHYPRAHQFNQRPSYLSSWCQTVSPFSHPLCMNYAMAWITRLNTVFCFYRIKYVERRNMLRREAVNRIAVLFYVLSKLWWFVLKKPNYTESIRLISRDGIFPHELALDLTYNLHYSTKLSFFGVKTCVFRTSHPRILYVKFIYFVQEESII